MFSELINPDLPNQRPFQKTYSCHFNINKIIPVSIALFSTTATPGFSSCSDGFSAISWEVGVVVDVTTSSTSLLPNGSMKNA